MSSNSGEPRSWRAAVESAIVPSPWLGWLNGEADRVEEMTAEWWTCAQAVARRQGCYAVAKVMVMAMLSLRLHEGE
jgi:hypothetical protein